jgi:hypothetical protein
MASAYRGRQVVRGDTTARLTGTCRSICCAQLRPMCTVSGPVPRTGMSRKNQPNQVDESCQHHPLGIWPGRSGPGDCCCSSSGLPPRSWLPWWPRPPCCPSPSRHSGSPALRCSPCQPRQPRRLHRPPPQATGSRPPRLPLPPLRPLGGEPSADRPRPPDRPRPKRRRPSTARPPPRRSRPRAPPPRSPP